MCGNQGAARRSSNQHFTAVDAHRHISNRCVASMRAFVLRGASSPAPAGLTAAPPRDAAVPSDKLREFILPYEAVRRSDAPDDRLLDFLQASYEAVANRGGWTARRSSAPI